MTFVTLIVLGVGGPGDSRESSISSAPAILSVTDEPRESRESATEKTASITVTLSLLVRRDTRRSAYDDGDGSSDGVGLAGLAAGEARGTDAGDRSPTEAAAVSLSSEVPGSFPGQGRGPIRTRIPETVTLHPSSSLPPYLTTTSIHPTVASKTFHPRSPSPPPTSIISSTTSPLTSTDLTVTVVEDRPTLTVTEEGGGGRVR